LCFNLIKALISAAIFGNVTTIMMKMYKGNEELKEMQDSVKDFIKFHGIPKTLSKRMTESFEHTWSFTNGIDMNTVLKSFPESLQADICLHLNRQLLSKSPAFQDATEGCMRMLALQFKSTHVPPGDTLIHKGDNLISIFFIARGTLEISRNGEVLAILDKNDIFGENIGKYQERDVMGRSSCDVRAMSYCDLHKIDRTDLLDVLEIYPDFAESFERKFQVTFDLRECEMFDPKPMKKKSAKALLKIATLNRFSSIHKQGNESTAGSVLRHQQSEITHTDQMNASRSSIAVNNNSNNNLSNSVGNIKASSGSGNIHSENLANVSPADSQLNAAMSHQNLNVNPSEMSIKFNQSFDFGSSSGVDAPRKFSTLLRKKSKMIRSAVRLNPVVSTAEKKTPSTGQLTAKKQVSSISEVENEIDNLLL
jgi:CRP-like cAMP-binding protein